MRRSLAASHLLRRRQARRSIFDFLSYVRVGYTPGPHHIELCRVLDRVVNGDIRRLIVEMPPRVGKSYHVSEGLPAYFMGRFPEKNIITASHGDSQARRFGRRVRKLLQTRRYQSVFPGTSIDKAAHASDEFMTQAGGMYLAVGIHGSFMGSGAHLLIIDDPFKNRRDADSPTVRQSVWDAYDDLESRLEPGAVLVVMHTRWHDDDTVGRIEKKRINTGVEDWARVTMPMIANECPQWEKVENGKGSDRDREQYNEESALWPDRYSLDDARKIRRTRPSRTWCALYQQRPHDERGDFFDVERIQRYPLNERAENGGPPVNVRRYLCADFGVKEGGDTTEIYCVAIDEQRHWWVTDCWTGQVKSDVWAMALVDMAKEHRPDAVAGEAGVIRRSVEPFIDMMIEESGVVTLFLWPVRSSNKQASAVPVQGIVSMGRLHVPTCGWGDRLVAVMRAFPTSSDDHGVDALANLGLAYEQTPKAFALPAPSEGAERGKDRWAKVLSQARSGGSKDWKTL